MNKAYVILYDKEIKGVVTSEKINAGNKMRALMDKHYKDYYLGKISKAMHKLMHEWEIVETNIID